MDVLVSFRVVEYPLLVVRGVSFHLRLLLLLVPVLEHDLTFFLSILLPHLIPSPESLFSGLA